MSGIWDRSTEAPILAEFCRVYFRDVTFLSQFHKGVLIFGRARRRFCENLGNFVTNHAWTFAQINGDVGNVGMIIGMNEGFQ